MNVKRIINLFRSRFFSRQDVYAEKWISKKTGRSGYAPVCINRFKRGICQIGKVSHPCVDCDNKKFKPISDDAIYQHILGKKIIGVYPLLPGGKTKFFALDFDNTPISDVDQVYRNIKTIYGLSVYPATSSSKGFHLYCFFEKPVPAYKIRAIASYILSEIEIEPWPEFFPKQDCTSNLGNLIRPPLTTPTMWRGRNAFLNPNNNWKPYPIEKQWQVLANAELIPEEQLDEIIDINQIPTVVERLTLGQRSIIIPGNSPDYNLDPANMHLIKERCAKIADIYQRQLDPTQSVHYDEWFAGIVGLYCFFGTQGEEYIHWLSLKDPRYNLGYTQARINQWKAYHYLPPSCRSKYLNCKKDPERDCGLKRRPPRKWINAKLVEIISEPQEKWHHPSPIRFGLKKEL